MEIQNTTNLRFKRSTRDRRYWPGTGIGIEDRIIVVETTQLLEECSRRIQKEKIVCVGGKPRT